MMASEYATMCSSTLGSRAADDGRDAMDPPPAHASLPGGLEEGAEGGTHVGSAASAPSGQSHKSHGEMLTDVD